MAPLGCEEYSTVDLLLRPGPDSAKVWAPSRTAIWQNYMDVIRRHHDMPEEGRDPTYEARVGL
jgi:hypothetical protein